MTKRKAKTYEAEHEGRKVRVTVPPNTEAEDALADAMRDNFSPEAVVAIASLLQLAATNDDNVARQVTWFREMLTEMIGKDEFNRISEEMGL